MATKFASIANIQRMAAAIKAKFVQKELKTGSTDAYKVLSDNNLTDAMVAKIDAAGTSSFNGTYGALTGKPTIEGKELASGANTAAGLGLATAAQGAKADSALQADSIATGTANGTVAVAGTDVAVKGLGTAAYTAASAYDAAGKADAALTSAKSYVDGKGYQDAAAVKKTVEGYGYQTAANVKATVEGYGYQTADDVAAAVSAGTADMATKTYVTGLGYQTAAQVQTAVDNALTSAIRPKGSSAFAKLPTPGKANLGWMYNVSDAFTTSASFTEGAGKAYPAGTNVVVVSDGNSYKWDVQGGFYDMTPYAKTADFAAMTDAEVDALFA